MHTTRRYTRSLHAALRAGTLLLLGIGASAQAQDYFSSVLPQRPARTEAVRVMLAFPCGQVQDPARPATVRRHVFDNLVTYEVDVYAAPATQTVVCITPRPDMGAYVNIGAVPAPNHSARVVQRAWFTAAGATEPVLVATVATDVSVSDLPGEAINGLYASPGTPGELTNITLAKHEGSALGDAFITTQLFDASGRLTPLTASGTFDGTEFSAAAVRAVRKNPEQRDVTVETLGSLHLRYLGCQRVEMRFHAIDAEMASVTRELGLLSQPLGVESCAPRARQYALATVLLFDSAPGP